MGGAKFKVKGAFGDPWRMFKNAAKAGDETGLVHLAGPVAPLVRMGCRPMCSDLAPGREPDIGVALGIGQKPLQPGDFARSADQPTVQADREHLGLTFGAFGVKRVECVAQVGFELLPGDITGGGGKAHVVGLERVGDDQLVAVANFPPIGQVIVVSI